MLTAILISALVIPGTQPQLRGMGPDTLTVDVAIVTDEADAALQFLAAPAAAREQAWRRLQATEGYQRLVRRQVSMGRPFSDSAFRAFMETRSLAERAPALRLAVEGWRKTDVSAAARQALAYLPAGTKIRARVYPVIKPTENSFVFFEDSLPPASFMYIDPAVSRAALENVITHELHHIGYRAACAAAARPDRPARVQTALDWLKAFGEGRAMLAAAGGPLVHPHATSPDSDRTRWDRDVGHAAADLAEVEGFVSGVLSGRLASEDSVTAAGMRFFGVQGPWYTVGWLMAATVERAFGRARLVDSSCDPYRFLIDYNAAAAGDASLPRWSDALLRQLAP